MSSASDGHGRLVPEADFFGLVESDPELLNSGRIPDPQPEHLALFRGLARVLAAIERRLRAVGSVTLRALIWMFFGLIAVIGAFLLVGPIINAPMTFDQVIESADVDEVDWLAVDVDIDYAIGRDPDGMFVANVTEGFTANFTNGSESSVQRTIVTEFEGHDVEFELRSATIDGEPAETKVSRHSTTTDVRLARADGADLSGEQRIELTYGLKHLVATATDKATDRVIDRLSWPLFAPTWPQGTRGIDVALTLSADVNEALIRDPSAYVGWLILSDTVQLEPEPETAEGVRYSFSNDDTLPPNADFWIKADFAAGTFVLPETTPLFWLQTYGPLLPMVGLAIIMLFAIAARRVVWADSAGDDWYKARGEPPTDISPVRAADLLGRSRHAELVDRLARQPARGRPGRGSREQLDEPRRRWLKGVAESGRRTGKWGSLPSAWGWGSRWGSAGETEKQGLRWVPRNYVRDFFLLAPVALTLLQWGLLRQLSYQRILAAVWMPFTFVVISTALAAVAVVTVWRPRPLTPEGARAVQQLKGIDVYARVTRLADRGPLGDPLLPYALLFERARAAGRIATRHAELEADDPALSRGWRNIRFISAPAILAMLASFALLAGAIAVVATQPIPYDGSADRITENNELPGTFGQEVLGFDISADLTRDAAGRAQLHVVEQQTVRFDGVGSNVPQFAREWPTERLGQGLDFELESVRIDGEDAPYRKIPHTGSTAMVTQFERVLDGAHEMRIEYTIGNAAVDARSDGKAVQQVRWTALYSFWEPEYYATAGDYSSGRSPVRPMRLQLTVAPDLVPLITSGGWITTDADLPTVPGEQGNTYRPWQYDNSFYGEHRTIGSPTPEYEIRIGEKKVGESGSLVVVFDADAVRSRLRAAAGTDTPERPFAIDPEVNRKLGAYELRLVGDLGAVLEFAPGTFDGRADGAYEAHANAYRLPFVLLLGLGGAVILASICVTAFATRTRREQGSSLFVVSFIAIPLALVAQCVLFFWVVPQMPGSDSRGGFAIGVGALMFAAVITQAVVVARRIAKRRTE